MYGVRTVPELKALVGSDWNAGILDMGCYFGVLNLEIC